MLNPADASLALMDDVSGFADAQASNAIAMLTADFARSLVLKVELFRRSSNPARLAEALSCSPTAHEV